jgi:hypothetical protein
VVDDEDILRVVVAEDEPVEEPAGAEHPTTAGPRVPVRQVERVAGR